MALTEKHGFNLVRENEGLVIRGLVRCTSFGRKRFVLSKSMDTNSTVARPMKKHCSDASFPSSGKSALEALPQDILIRILCGVEHDDLSRLIHVSKSIRNATLIAEQWHFSYSTPTKKLGFKDFVHLEDANELNHEVEAPNAPRQLRIPGSRLSRNKLAGISVALFASPDEDAWPRPSKDLDVEMETKL